MAPPSDEPPKTLADLGIPPLPWFLATELEDIISEYDKLWEVEDPETTPYKTKYEARKLLENAIEKLDKLIEQAGPGDEANEGHAAAAHLLSHLGKNLYWCEEVPQSEVYLQRSLERYMRSPLRLKPKHFIRLQDLFNQIGKVWCTRNNHGEGMNYLRRAQIMYLNRPQEVKDTCNQQAEDNYTLTMFYLAQAYGSLHKPSLSARFCAGTMSRQLDHNTSGTRSKEVLERDPFDCKDWVRNCCSLSDFFISECMFWTAEYLLHTSIIMCENCEQICGFSPESIEELLAECHRDMGNLYSTRLKFAKTCSENPEMFEEIWRGDKKTTPEGESEEKKGSKLTFRCAADLSEERPPEGGTGPIVYDSIFPEVVYLEDEEAEDNRLAEETADEQSGQAEAAKAAGRPAEAGWLDLGHGLRVRLPVHFNLLHAQAQQRMRRANAHFLELHSANVVPGKTSCVPTCVSTDFPGVREIFKLSNHYFSKALGHFLLDGWVTEHVKILQELSQVYRTLLFWEQDPKRLAAMLMRRVRMLAPLLEVLNQKVYIAFWRQLSLEVAEVLQELYHLKADGQRPGQRPKSEEAEDEKEENASVAHAARCNDLARKSITFFETFINSYATDGQPPNRVEKESAHAYMTARMHIARLRTKMRGQSIEELLTANRLALREYEWILAYVDRHPDVATDPEIGLAQELGFVQEMVSMLPSKLDKLAHMRR